MKIINAKRHLPELEEDTSSANKFVRFIVLASLIVGILLVVFFHDFIGTILNAVELTQAVLVASTAIMGLAGLMVIEIRKTDVTIPTREETQGLFDRVDALNLVHFLIRADVFLRWCLVFSPLSILFGCWWLAFPNAIVMMLLIFSFFNQVYYFVWGLSFTDMLPS